MNLGPLELGLILVIVLLIFGVGKLPEVFRSLGQGIREFREAASSPDEDDSKSSDTPGANQAAK
jgi:sec-independent protein translocase protein TatA